MKFLCTVIVIAALAAPAFVAADSPFYLVKDKAGTPILLDASDAPVVSVSAEALAGDIQQITGIKPELISNGAPDSRTAIIVGTLGRSSVIDKLAKSGKIPAEKINGKWESFLIQPVDHPTAGLDRILVIAGSDPRGTAFGIFELSKRLGVSPWIYWADVKPERKEELSISFDQVLMGPPSVKYRGIFLNDEDWGLQPWAAANMDTDIEDIGPNTYARIFELMLRLKANYIWPAMHPCTKAFFYYKENAEVAAQYDIVLGSSHCEPMLRNNVDEWKNNFADEYGKEPGPWRYDTNPKEISRYWEDRVKESAGIDAVYTVGMRGIHDGSMPGPKDTTEKIKLLNQVIEDQRDMLSDILNKPETEISQIFCPYKEVLTLYQKGAEIPEDVTILWADDNHGYIRKLSTPEEQERSGASGVYYHLSYWGAPADYLWLSSISPSLISYEMSKAFKYGADRVWIFNVGDIKPAEMETEFAMDLAWDVSSWPPERAAEYCENWAERTFGKEYAKAIADIQRTYYTLAAAGKPEHLDQVAFTEDEQQERLAQYARIEKQALDLQKHIPERLQDAYFELVLYPVLGAANMNRKYFDPDEAQQAYDEIKRLTQVYNEDIADGKWRGMMDMAPRRRPVFGLPETFPHPKEQADFIVIKTQDLTLHGDDLIRIPGLGSSGLALSRKSLTGPGYDKGDANKAPYVTIQQSLTKGKRTIEVRCLPTHPIHEERNLKAAISLSGKNEQVLDFNAPSKSKEWQENVLRGYSSATATFDVAKDSDGELRISLLDPGLCIDSIYIY